MTTRTSLLSALALLLTFLAPQAPAVLKPLQYNPMSSDNNWINIGLFSNTVAGGIWNNGNSVALPTSLVGTVSFGIRIVSAYHPGATTYFDTNGTPLNNNSANIRLDNVTLRGTPIAAATSEPGSVVC